MFRKPSYRQRPWEWRRLLVLVKRSNEVNNANQQAAAQERLKMAEKMFSRITDGSFFHQGVDVPDHVMRRLNARAHNNMHPAPFPDVLEGREKEVDPWLRVYHNSYQLLNGFTPKFDFPQSESEITLLQNIFPGIVGLHQLSYPDLERLRQICVQNLDGLLNSNVPDAHISDSTPDLSESDFSGNNSPGSSSSHGRQFFFPGFNGRKVGTGTGTGEFQSLPVETQARVQKIISQLREP